MVALLTVEANRLVYPGIQARVNSSHFAAGTKLRFAGIARQGTFFNLINSVTASSGGAASTSSINNYLGPVTTVTSASTLISFTVPADSGQTALTMAAIFSLNNTSAFGEMFSIDGGAFAMTSNSGGFEARTGGSQFSSGITLVANVPYFAVFSTGGPSNNINFVVKRLDNGKVFTGTATGNGSSTGAGTTYAIGNATGAGFPLVGNIAAIGYSIGYLSMPQLKLWAEDPWSLWYPNQVGFEQFLHGTFGVSTGGQDTWRQRQILLRKPGKASKLEYPGSSVAPGIDYSHPAAQGCVVAAVPGVGGKYINLLNATANSVAAGSPTSTIMDGNIGRVVNNNSAGYQSYFPGLGTVPTTITIAGIFRLNSAGSYQSLIVLNGGANEGLYIRGSSSAVDWYYHAGDNISSLSVTVGAPYFLVVSQTGVSNSGYNLLIKNLSTGQVQTQIVSGGLPPTQVDIKVQIGNDASGDTMNGYLAAAMYSRAYLTIQQMQQWAEDPWSLWYSQTLGFEDELKTAAAAAAAALRFNASLNGLGGSGPFFHDRIAT